jgi:hypothetical protein
VLHRIGWSVQIPSRKSTERDEERIAAWKDEQWPVIKESGGLGRLTLLRGRSRPGHVLALDADRASALLHIAGLVDDENRTAVTEGVDDVVT